MRRYIVNPGLIFMFWSVAPALLSRAAYVDAQPAHSHAYRVEAPAQRRSVIDYFNLLPQLGVGYPATRQERRELLQSDNHPIVDVHHDYLLVRPDSSPAEQIAVFRTRNKPDLIAVSLPDFESDYNDFALYRLQNGELRDVTGRMLPIHPDEDQLLYELPRFGTTIQVFRFNIETASRRHVFDLQWRGGHFVKVH